MTAAAASVGPSAGRPDHPAPRPWEVALAGAVALAVAMGIGRFAFTPLLPMMLADGVVDLPAASWLASANYLGYLAGALLCTLQPWIWARVPGLPAVDGPFLVRFGLAATGLLTVAMALPWAPAWAALRFAAGVASALVFIYSSAWCLAQLARQGASALGGVMFVGPGAGIVLTGLLASAMVAAAWRATSAWLVFGVLAFALSATVWRLFTRRASAGDVPSAGAPGAAASAASATASGARADASARIGSAGAAASPPIAPAHGRIEIGALAFAYGLAGFGYIVTATFLPVIARQALPGSAWLDFFWPIFGAGVMVGALLSTRLRVSGDLRLLLAGAYLMQAAGIGVNLWSPTLGGFALGSLLLGLPFTAITFFAMQEVRRLRPDAVASVTGLLTTMWSLGQIVGPLMAAALLRRGAGSGFTLSLEIAATALVVGAAIYLATIRAFPKG